MKPYSFQSQYKGNVQKKKKKDVDAPLNKDDVLSLMANLKLTSAETKKDLQAAFEALDKEDQNLLELFVRNNIRNIRWYDKRISRENTYRYLYATITMLFVFGVPTLIGYVTFFSKNFNFDTTELIGTTLTLLVSSLLGVHKLITSWMEKRKYRSLFFQAKTDLQNILFTLDEQARLLVNAQTTETKEDNTTVVISSELYDLIFEALKASRKVVQDETKAYFELSSTSTFDLGTLLSESGKAAKSLVSVFKSHSYDLEQKKTAEEQKKQDRRQKEKVQSDARMKLRANLMRLERQTHKEMLLLERLDQLEQKSRPSAADKNEIDALNSKLDVVQDTIETLEIECLQLQSSLPEGDLKKR